MAEVITYPKIVALSKIEPFFEGTRVRIEEKIDGSNVGIRYQNGELILQSRTTIIDQSAPTIFAKVVAWAQQHEPLTWIGPHTILYGEMVGHGKIRYPDTAPFILFDVKEHAQEKSETYWCPVVNTARTLDIPYVEPLYEGPYRGLEHAQSLIGPSRYNPTVTMEGVVVKAYDVPMWYENAKGERIEWTEPLLCGKVVREDYKEVKAPKTSTANQDDPHSAIVAAVVTPARIEKAKQRLQEEGRYDPLKPQLLIPIVAKDVHDEEKELVRDMLFKAYWKAINRRIAQHVIEEINKGA